MSETVMVEDGGGRAASRSGAGMTLWRLEVLRLLRTHRWMILFGIYVLFGVVGALSARYLNEMLERMGGEMTIVAPDPRPVDGLIQYVSNTSQLGLLAVVVVAAAALAFDAHPERAAFLRTRMERPGRLVLAPYLVTTVATMLAMILGTVVAVALTSVLIGDLPVGEVAIGTLYGALYLAFAIAVVAVVASLVRSQVGVVFGALGALIVLPMLAMVEAIRPWVPSELLTAVIAVVEGEDPTAYLRATAVGVVATVGLLLLAMRRLERREL
jgi:ABC-2 type transport system permease protein